MIHLFKRAEDGKLVLCWRDGRDLAAYAILSYSWNTDDNPEVTLDNLNTGTGERKDGYRKAVYLLLNSVVMLPILSL
jgi:hypothetical protein